MIISVNINALVRLFKSPRQKPETADQTLSFDGLNPLLAKQLSELETQIGQLAQVQFELSQERQRMRIEMDALRKAVGEPTPTAAVPLNSDNEKQQ
jgi:regulator of replication initiation timing